MCSHNFTSLFIAYQKECLLIFLPSAVVILFHAFEKKSCTLHMAYAPQEFAASAFLGLISVAERRKRETHVTVWVFSRLFPVIKRSSP